MTHTCTATEMATASERAPTGTAASADKLESDTHTVDSVPLCPMAEEGETSAVPYAAPVSLLHM